MPTSGEIYIRPWVTYTLNDIETYNDSYRRYIDIATEMRAQRQREIEERRRQITYEDWFHLPLDYFSKEPIFKTFPKKTAKGNRII